MKWYRVEDRRYASPVDEFDNPCGPSRLMVQLLDYEVLKETATGVWVSYGCSKRFVKKEAKKRFACPTTVEAFESFTERKKRQIKILEERLFAAKDALRAGEKYLEVLKSNSTNKNTT